MRRSLEACGALALLLAAGCASAPVARIVDGRPVDGHFIPPEGYAAYLDGTLLEARGDEVNAAHAYERAIAVDPNSGELWARLGAVTCLLTRATADAAFTHARSLSPEVGDVFLAHGACALRRGDVRTATASALRAAALDPDDPETSKTVADALERGGDSAGAARWRRALGLRDGVAPSREPERPRLGASRTALQALTQGQIAVAQATAARALLADPGDVEARIAALAAADLAHDEEAFHAAAAPLPAVRTTPGASAEEAMEALILRRSGAEAARAWAVAWRSRITPPSGAPSPAVSVVAP